MGVIVKYYEIQQYQPDYGFTVYGKTRSKSDAISAALGLDGQVRILKCVTTEDVVWRSKTLKKKKKVKE